MENNTNNINASARFNEVCNALSYANPKKIESLIYELVDLTVAQLKSNPSPALINRAMDASANATRWNRRVFSYLLLISPFAFSQESKRFEGKLNKRKNRKKFPSFQEFIEKQKEETKRERELLKEQKPKADNQAKILALWNETDEADKIALIEKLSKSIDKQKMLDILNSI